MNKHKKNMSGIGDVHMVTVIVFVVITIVAFVSSVLIEEEIVFTPNSNVSSEFRMLTDEITADAAIIYDLGTGAILAGKETYAPFSIASVTKLITALIAYSRLETDDVSVISSADFALTANTPIRLGDAWNSIDLLEYSLITSSNRGINAVGRTVEEKTGKPIIDFMNLFSRENQLASTHFVNPTGLDIHTQLSGSESSPFDLARIVGVILSQHPKLAEVTTLPEKAFHSLDAVEYLAVNTNKLIGTLDGTLLLSKTGYTDIAGGALIVAMEIERRRIVFVVLGSTRNGRFTDMQKLIEVYTTEFANKPLFVQDFLR